MVATAPTQTSAGSVDRSLAAEGLVKDYALDRGRHRAVDGVSFDISEGHFYSLLGPSGCGKTTTLRCVAGLERPDVGSIDLAGVRVAGPEVFLPPEKRDIGMVFQNYAIWPHMSVFENAAFPLRFATRKVPAAEIRKRTDEILGLVQLSD